MYPTRVKSKNQIVLVSCNNHTRICIVLLVIYLFIITSQNTNSETSLFIQLWVTFTLNEPAHKSITKIPTGDARKICQYDGDQDMILIC